MNGVQWVAESHPVGPTSSIAEGSAEKKRRGGKSHRDARPLTG